MNLLKTYSIKEIVVGLKVNGAKLEREIDASGSIEKYKGLHIEGDTISVYGESFINETLLNTLVASHIANDLNDKKINKIKLINIKTEELIEKGFEFDNNTFSLSTKDQIRWFSLKNLETIIVWPLDISTINDRKYSLKKVNLMQFVSAANKALQSRLSSGLALKVLVHNATTESEINAVEDGR